MIFMVSFLVKNDPLKMFAMVHKTELHILKLSKSVNNTLTTEVVNLILVLEDEEEVAMVTTETTPMVQYFLQISPPILL